MTKFHSILLLAIISIFAISCENTNPIYNDFIGEYEMTTEVIPVYGDTEIDFLPVVKSNVTIYEEKNKLFSEHCRVNYSVFFGATNSNINVVHSVFEIVAKL